MGIRCSVLGHDYGETGVERERDERGAEVVRTARQVRTCRRCGHERTVTENTEITTLEPGAGVVRDADGQVVAATAEENVATDGTGTITIEDDLDDTNESGDTASDGPAGDGSTDDGASASEAAVTAASEGGDRADDAEPRDHQDASSDGERIPTVEDADDTGGRAPGEWPADPDDGATSATRSGGTSTTGSLTPIDGGSHATNAASEPKPLSDGWAVETDATTADAGGANDTAGEGHSGETFACSACGFTAAIADSPLRAGDICPECRAGYLARRTRKG